MSDFLDKINIFNKRTQFLHEQGNCACLLERHEACLFQKLDEEEGGGQRDEDSELEHEILIPETVKFNQILRILIFTDSPKMNCIVRMFVNLLFGN